MDSVPPDNDKFVEYKPKLNPESLPAMYDPYVPPPPRTVIPNERPGCIRLYVYFMTFAWALALLGVYFGATTTASEGGAVGEESTISIVIFVIVSMLLLLLGFIYLRGIWRMRNWARLIAIGLHGLVLLGSATSLYSTFGTGATNTSRYSGQVLGILITVWIIIWFATNRKRFN